MFNKEKILRAKTQIHCETEEEAKALLLWAHSLGRAWSSGDSYETHIKWGRHGKHTVYNIYEGLYGSVENIANYQTVLKFSEVIESPLKGIYE